SRVDSVAASLCGGAPPTEINTLSLHDALPISHPAHPPSSSARVVREVRPGIRAGPGTSKQQPKRFVDPLAVQQRRRHHHQPDLRSEEHTSELQSRENLVCRLLLEKKNDTGKPN